MTAGNDHPRDGALRLPPERLYWARLEGLPARPGEEALLYAFEPWLPAPLEEVETRFVRTEDGWIACGIERDRLRAAIEDVEAQGQRVESARPRGTPEALGLSEGEAARICDRMEFRSGAFESASARRAKRVAIAAPLAAACLAAALLVGGFVQRQRAMEREAEAAESAAAALARDAIGAGARLNGLDPRLRLAAELRRLRSTRDRSAAGLLPEDRSDALIDLLAAWPEDLPTVVDRIEIDQDTATIRGRVREPAEYEALARHLAGFAPGWGEPTGSVTREREGYGFTLVMRRREAPEGGDA